MDYLLPKWALLYFCIFVMRATQVTRVTRVMQVTRVMWVTRVTQVMWVSRVTRVTWVTRVMWVFVYLRICEKQIRFSFKKIQLSLQCVSGGNNRDTTYIWATFIRRDIMQKNVFFFKVCTRITQKR